MNIIGKTILSKRKKSTGQLIQNMPYQVRNNVMKVNLTIFLLFLCQCFFSQFAIIQSKSGFANIFDDSDNKKVIEKLNNGEVIYCLWPEKDYYEVDFQTHQKIKSGFIHKSRIKFIDKFTQIPCVEIQDNQMIFHNDSIEVTITDVPFKKNQFFLEYENDNQSGYLKRIIGKEYWGSDGGLPKIQYDQISILLGKKKILLPKESFNDLFNPNLIKDATSVYFDKRNNSLYITGFNSDGAGGYVVLWVIQNGKYKSRLVTHGF